MFFDESAKLDTDITFLAKLFSHLFAQWLYKRFGLAGSRLYPLFLTREERIFYVAVGSRPCQHCRKLEDCLPLQQVPSSSPFNGILLQRTLSGTISGMIIYPLPPFIYIFENQFNHVSFIPCCEYITDFVVLSTTSQCL